jgi:hypothetical protein
MIASIHGDVISTLGPVRYCECEVLHTASNIFIGHKTPTLTRATDRSCNLLDSRQNVHDVALAIDQLATECLKWLRTAPWACVPETAHPAAKVTITVVAYFAPQQYLAPPAPDHVLDFEILGCCGVKKNSWPTDSRDMQTLRSPRSITPCPYRLGLGPFHGMLKTQASGRRSPENDAPEKAPASVTALPIFSSVAPHSRRLPVASSTGNRIVLPSDNLRHCLGIAQE